MIDLFLLLIPLRSPHINKSHPRTLSQLPETWTDLQLPEIIGSVTNNRTDFKAVRMKRNGSFWLTRQVQTARR